MSMLTTSVLLRLVVKSSPPLSSLLNDFLYRCLHNEEVINLVSARTHVPLKHSGQLWTVWSSPSVLTCPPKQYEQRQDSVHIVVVFLLKQIFLLG